MAWHKSDDGWYINNITLFGASPKTYFLDITDTPHGPLPLQKTYIPILKKMKLFMAPISLILYLN